MGLSLVAGAGCAGDAPPDDRKSWKGLEAADRSVADARSEARPRTPVAPDQRPAAILGNETISWADLGVPLSEAAGAAVLEEVCLDRLIAREMQLRGLTLESGAAKREEDLLVETLALTAGVPVGQQGDLVQQLRRTRGLGDRRYTTLLQRNAMLRRMVRDEVSVTPEDVKQAFEIRYGQRFQTRLILMRTEREAADALARLRAGDPFADVAIRVSTDSSRFRGGFIGDISPADPAFPLALRKTIAETRPGSPSGVVALEQGYAIILVEQVIPPSATDFDAAAPALEREVRLVRERAAMDRLAAQLLRSTTITVLDPSLDWSWKGREARQ